MKRSAKGARRADSFTLAVGYAFLVLFLLAIGIGPFVAALAWRDFGPYEFAPVAHHDATRKG